MKMTNMIRHVGFWVVLIMLALLAAVVGFKPAPPPNISNLEIEYGTVTSVYYYQATALKQSRTKITTDVGVFWLHDLNIVVIGDTVQIRQYADGETSLCVDSLQTCPYVLSYEKTLEI